MITVVMVIVMLRYGTSAFFHFHLATLQIGILLYVYQSKAFLSLVKLHGQIASACFVGFGKFTHSPPAQILACMLSCYGRATLNTPPHTSVTQLTTQQHSNTPPRSPFVRTSGTSLLLFGIGLVLTSWELSVRNLR